MSIKEAGKQMKFLEQSHEAIKMLPDIDNGVILWFLVCTSVSSESRDACGATTLPPLISRFFSASKCSLILGYIKLESTYNLP